VALSTLASASCSGGGYNSTSTPVICTDGQRLCRLLISIVPMATMALSVVVVDGYNGTVDPRLLLSPWTSILISWLVRSVGANGHSGSVGFVQCRVPLL
jgi:hypothetical protein